MTSTENWDQQYAGAGFADSAAQIVSSIQNGDWLSSGANLGAASLDLLGVIDNPVKAIATSVIGWIWEHFAIFDSFLDWTTGDPGAVQNATETYFRAAQDLDGLAASQIRSFGLDVQTYRAGRSQSAVAFENRVGPRADELRTLSLQCLGLGHTMNFAGMLVSTCRGMMRDILTEMTWWLLKKAVIAVASAPYTCGGSVSALLTDAMIMSARAAKNIADLFTTLARDLGGLFGKLRQLAAILDSPVARTTAVAALKNYVPSMVKAADTSESLSAADAAQHEVEERTKAPAPPPTFPPPRPTRPVHGPPSSARWTTSGTLDE